MKNTGNKVGSLSLNPGMDAIQNRHRKKPPKTKRVHRTPPNDRESAVLKECLRFLNGLESVVYVERRNTGAAKYIGGYFVRFGSPGAADIWCLIRCRSMKHYDDGWICGGNVDSSCDGSCLTHIEIECKNRTGKGRLSEDQKTFKRMCGRVGIPFFMVTSAEDLREQLQGAGLLEV